MTRRQRCCKRAFDIFGASLGIVVTFPLVVVALVIARWETGQSGIYRQKRVGRGGRLFHVMKIRTMRDLPSTATTITTRNDPRITRCGRIMRRLKIDELPQLYNVLRGDMSFVGPRPDVPEQMEQLSGTDLVILSVRPGITGPASLKYRDEESLLAAQPDPEEFNRTVIFPDKVRINRQYVMEYRLWKDVVSIWRTVFGRSAGTESAPPLPDSGEDSRADQAREQSGGHCRSADAA